MALLSATAFNYILSLTGVVLLYIFYTSVRKHFRSVTSVLKISVKNNLIIILFFLQPGDCGLQKFFISFILILALGVSTVSILPSVQERQPRSGLLQSSVVTLYTVYLTWSALSSSSGEEKALL